MAVVELFVSKAAAPVISPALRIVREEFALMLSTTVQVHTCAVQGFRPPYHIQWLKQIS